MLRFIAAVALAGCSFLGVGSAAADTRPLCWFGETGAVAPCGDGYGNGNGQLTAAQQMHECALFAQNSPAERPNWYASTCIG